MLTYQTRNLENISKLADNTKVAALKWHEYLVANNIDILIYETIRTVEQQRENVRKGASQTMKSYHLVGQALDFVPIVNGKSDWNGYGKAIIKQAIAEAKRLGFEWGGDWKGFIDKPHLQFNYKGYGTDTFGKVVASPTPIPAVAGVQTGQVLVLPANADTWTVYHVNRPPVKSNSANVAGTLKPSKFNGLRYSILDKGAEPDTYIIQTSNFGKVKIYATTDLGASFEGGSVQSTPVQPTPQPVQQPKKRYVVLPATDPTWRVYPLNKTCRAGNEVGKLAPQRFGGLEYEILVDRGHVYGEHWVFEIQTQSFGRVKLYGEPSTGARVIEK